VSADELGKWKAALADRHRQQRQQRGRRERATAVASYQPGMARISPPAADDDGVPDASFPPRCPIRGCPQRYRAGPDRLCPSHQDGPDDATARMAAMGMEMATRPGDYTAAMATGDSDGDHDASTEGSPPHFIWKQAPS
jgi:hypothetical protein